MLPPEDIFAIPFALLFFFSGIQGRLHWGPWSWLKKRGDKRSVRDVEGFY